MIVGRIPTRRLERLFPKTQARQSRLDCGPAGPIEPDDAHVVGDDSMAAVVKPGGESRFARSRSAHECYGPAIDFDRVGMQRQQTALVEQGAERGPEQVEAN